MAGDYVPYVPRRAELPAESADDLLRFLHQATPEERGPELARPSSVLVYNDMRHLPAELSWTGFPAGQRI